MIQRIYRMCYVPVFNKSCYLFNSKYKTKFRCAHKSNSFASLSSTKQFVCQQTELCVHHFIITITYDKFYFPACTSCLRKLDFCCRQRSWKAKKGKKDGYFWAPPYSPGLRRRCSIGANRDVDYRFSWINPYQQLLWWLHASWICIEGIPQGQPSHILSAAD